MTTSLKLQEYILSEIWAHASHAYPQECCGVLLGDGETQCVKELCPLQNKSVKERRGEHFRIDPLELYTVEREADAKHLQVIGFYHSHPDHPAQLSGEDEEYMIPGLIYLVVSLTDGKIAEQKSYRKTKPDEGAFELNTDY